MAVCACGHMQAFDPERAVALEGGDQKGRASFAEPQGAVKAVIYRCHSFCFVRVGAQLCLVSSSLGDAHGVLGRAWAC